MVFHWTKEKMFLIKSKTLSFLKRRIIPIFLFFFREAIFHCIKHLFAQAQCSLFPSIHGFLKKEKKFTKTLDVSMELHVSRMWTTSRSRYKYAAIFFLLISVDFWFVWLGLRFVLLLSIDGSSFVGPLLVPYFLIVTYLPEPLPAYPS